MKLPLVFTWPYFIAFWVVFIWAFAPEGKLLREARAGAEERGSKDKRSYHAIAYGNNVALILGLLFPFIAHFATLPHPFICYWSGIALIVIGSLLRRHCWRVLGEYFTGDVKAREGQPVITRGAYRFVRHPSYTAGMIMFLGIGLANGNALSVAVMLAIPFSLYLYRVSVEERALTETIGEPYREYMRTHKRFVPFVI
jgi:protein-S-isoprenylcysteine O-methyltransferase Ste14